MSTRMCSVLRAVRPPIGSQTEAQLSVETRSLIPTSKATAGVCH